jgi:succinate dehydrogenase / fumarate reductase cytochrome b subunit
MSTLITSLKTSLTGYVRYRGREGHLSFVLHRLTGLGTLLFLTIHIIDMAAFYWAPDFFRAALDLYRTWPYQIGEIALVFAVLFHGANGIRIAVVDMFLPHKWAIQAERNAVRWTLAITLVLWLPAALYMGIRIFNPEFNLFFG